MLSWIQPLHDQIMPPFLHQIHLQCFSLTLWHLLTPENQSNTQIRNPLSHSVSKRNIPYESYLQRAERHTEIVKPSREYKLLHCTSNYTWLSVTCLQLKITNLIWFTPCLICKNLPKQKPTITTLHIYKTLIQI